MNEVFSALQLLLEKESLFFWLSQLVIPFCGAAAIWCSQSLDVKKARWACIFGLISQPFWFYSTWQSGQWGIFAACFLYLLAWLKGFRRHWLPLLLKEKSHDTLS